MLIPCSAKDLAIMCRRSLATCAALPRVPDVILLTGDLVNDGTAEEYALLAEARAAALPVAGLMAVPPFGVDSAPYFALLDELAERHGLPLRSMGMSGDYEKAVMLGATHVRVGTALFGARD